MIAPVPRLDKGRDHSQLAGNGAEVWGLVEAPERAEALIDGVAGEIGARSTEP